MRGRREEKGKGEGMRGKKRKEERKRENARRGVESRRLEGNEWNYVKSI